jgi:hypothetical protein
MATLAERLVTIARDLRLTADELVMLAERPPVEPPRHTEVRDFVVLAEHLRCAVRFSYQGAKDTDGARDRYVAPTEVRNDCFFAEDCDAAGKIKRFNWNRVREGEVRLDRKPIEDA